MSGTFQNELELILREVEKTCSCREDRTEAFPCITGPHDGLQSLGLQAVHYFGDIYVSLLERE